MSLLVVSEKVKNVLTHTGWIGKAKCTATYDEKERVNERIILEYK